MSFVVLVEIDNAAFDPEPAVELARILRELADRVERGQPSGLLRDVNGNIVGSSKFNA